MISNGSVKRSLHGAGNVYRKLNPGVYVPLPTFFDAKDELDLESFSQHLLRMCSLGMIPVVAGSLGEAVHLDREERQILVRTTRHVLDENGMSSVPIVAGVGGSSTKETIRLAKDAVDAGADAGMIIPPAYFAGMLSNDPSQIVSHFEAVSSSVNLPILLYNFPSNAGGLDLSSTVIKQVIERAPSVIGVKLTCPGSMGKMLRLRQHLDANPSLSASRPYPFLILDGLIADLVPWTHSRGDGTVSGLMNYVPRCCMRLWELCLQGRTGNLSDAELLERDRLQAALGEVDVAAVPGGIRAMKYALNKLHGYGVSPRLPLCPLPDTEGVKFMTILQPVLELEKEYAAAVMV